MTDLNSLIAVDVGNSSIKFGLFRSMQGQTPSKQRQFEQTHHQTHHQKPLAFCAERMAHFSDLASWLELFDGQTTCFHWVISSVNQQRCTSLLNWLEQNRPQETCREVTLADIPLNIGYDFPDRLGIDRAVAAYAGKLILPPFQPFLLVDIGTATTIDYVDEKGNFRGGAILPGPQTAAESLHLKTALLPQTELLPPKNTPSPLTEVLPYPATNTEDGIRMGICQSLVGAIFSFYLQVSHDLQRQNITSKLAILITGGSGFWIEHQLESIFETAIAFFGTGVVPQITHCQHLTLTGLAIMEINKP